MRNNCSDGAPPPGNQLGGRCPERHAGLREAGSLSYIDIPVDLSSIPPTHMDGALLADVVGSPNAVTLRYDETERALAVTTSSATNDPYAFAELFRPCSPSGRRTRRTWCSRSSPTMIKPRPSSCTMRQAVSAARPEQCTRVFPDQAGRRVAVHRGGYVQGEQVERDGQQYPAGCHRRHDGSRERDGVHRSHRAVPER